MLTERELEVLLRRARKENQEDIAKALKITQAAVSQFEKNAHKKIFEAQKLQEILSKEKISIQKGVAQDRVVYGGKRK